MFIPKVARSYFLFAICRIIYFFYLLSFSVINLIYLPYLSFDIHTANHESSSLSDFHSFDLLKYYCFQKISVTSKSKKRLRPDVDQSHKTINGM